MSDTIGIQIGTSKETVSETGKIILEILLSGQDQETIRLALNTLIEISQVKNAQVSNNVLNFHTNKDKK